MCHRGWMVDGTGKGSQPQRRSLGGDAGDLKLRHYPIMGGLDTWPAGLDEIVEPRLSRVLQQVTEVPSPRLGSPHRGAVRPTEPAVDPHRVECLLPAGRECSFLAGPR